MPPPIGSQLSPRVISQLIQSFVVSSTTCLRSITLPALRDLVLTASYDKDRDQPAIDLSNGVIVALSNLICYSHYKLIKLSVVDTTVIDNNPVEVLRLTPCPEGFAIQFDEWDEGYDPGMELLSEGLEDAESMDESVCYLLVHSLRCLCVVLEGFNNIHILCVDHNFLHMIIFRRHADLLMEVDLRVIGWNWSYKLDWEDEDKLERL